MSWEVFIPLQFSGRVYVELVVFFPKCVAEFTSEGFWTQRFLFGEEFQALDNYFFLLLLPDLKGKSSSIS